MLLSLNLKNYHKNVFQRNPLCIYNFFDVKLNKLSGRFKKIFKFMLLCYCFLTMKFEIKTFLM